MSQPLDKYFAKLLDMFCRVGRLLPRYGSWHEQFSRQETLRHALCTTFLELVHFCIDAKDAVSMIKESLGRVSITISLIVCGPADHLFPHVAGRGLSSRIVWDAFKGRYNAYLSNFSILGRQVQREANFAFVVHARSVCKANEARKRLLETTSKAEEQRKVLSLLPSVNYRSEHRRIQSRREEVSGTWLVRERSFQTWLDSQASECFGCFGDVESEKTELASVAIDYLAANFARRNSALCYHYCDPTYPESMDPDVVIATLTHQLLEKTVLPTGLAQEIRELFNGEDAPPDWEDISALLHAALSNFQKVVVVLDGVDELDAKAQAAITSIFLELTYREDHIVKVLVFGRHQQSIVGKALYDCSRVEIPAQKVEKDFVRCTVSRVDQKLEACLI